MADFKRIVFVSDLHSGHRAGLTDPAHFWEDTKGEDPSRDKYGAFQRALYSWWKEEARALGKVSYLVCVGDALEGKDPKTGGTELLEADRKKQVEIAEACLRCVKAENYRFLYGTNYHVGSEEDWESVLADRMGGIIKSHYFIDVNGTVFDAKHKVSGSTVPHGRLTAPQRERIWNMLWAEREEQPKAQILIRGHVHYFTLGGDSRGLAITLPAMQGPGSKFGARLCSGTIDVGFVHFDCYPNGEYEYVLHKFDARFAAEQAEKA